jgi:hypothetical protein
MSESAEEPNEIDRDGNIKVTREGKAEETNPQNTNRDGIIKILRDESAEQKVEPPKNTVRGG